jgi:hypothetical protein
MKEERESGKKERESGKKERESGRAGESTFQISRVSCFLLHTGPKDNHKNR